MEKSLIQRVKSRIREHGESYKINQLCMDELPMEEFTPEICKQLQKCINVEYITFENCGLKALDNLPRFPKLQSLQLGYNKISGDSIKFLTKYPTLTNLSLQQNNIAKTEDLAPLQSSKQLAKLNIRGNPFCTENYRTQIFALLPQLEMIDGVNKTGQAVKQESSSQGQSEFSESQIELSEDEQQRESPTKIKRKN